MGQTKGPEPRRRAPSGQGIGSGGCGDEPQVRHPLSFPLRLFNGELDAA